MEWIADPQIWISLLTLSVLEIVLGVDNIIFISILAGKLPAEQQGKARSLGLILALVTRIMLLSFIFLLTGLTQTVITIFHLGLSWKDLVMLLGGLFLIWKSVKEIHGNLEGEEHTQSSSGAAAFNAVIMQIVIIDIVFSLDSVITAVGLAKEIGVMIAAVVIAMGVMLVAAKSISDFVNKHPTVKMLALSFLMMVGVVLVADGLHHHIEKGYVYFAMAFSFIVEVLNIRSRKAAKPVQLHSKY